MSDAMNTEEEEAIETADVKAHGTNTEEAPARDVQKERAEALREFSKQFSIISNALGDALNSSATKLSHDMMSRPEFYANHAAQLDLEQHAEMMKTMLENNPGFLDFQRQALRNSRVIKTNVAAPQDAIFLSFRQVLALEHFPDRQTLEKSSESSTGVPFLHAGQTDIWLAIFLSHRWESPDHPDPEGHQLSTLKQFICMVLSLLQLSRGYTVQCSLPKTLTCHGWLQAAYVAGLDSLRTRGNKTSSSDELVSLLLDHCGIWYDFSCLYQKPRNDEQEISFRTSLKTMTELVGGCSCTICLRSLGDDYMERGWCVYEMQASSKDCLKGPGQIEVTFPLDLNVDQLGKPFPDGLLSYEKIVPNPVFQLEFVKSRAALLWALQAWQRCMQLDPQDSSPKVRNVLETITDSLFAPFIFLSDDTGVIAKASPIRKFGDLVVRKLKKASDDLVSGAQESFDFYPILKRSMTDAEFKCSNGKDEGFLALKILEMYHPPTNLEGLPKPFVQEAIRRLLDKEPLVIRLAEAGVTKEPEFFFEGNKCVCYKLYPQAFPAKFQNMMHKCGMDDPSSHKFIGQNIVEIKGLVSAEGAKYNGRLGKLVDRDPNGRYVVDMLPSSGDRKSFKEENLTHPTRKHSDGTKVRLCGIAARDGAFNGKLGFIQGFHVSSGRYIVECSGERFRILPFNFQVLEKSGG